MAEKPADQVHKRGAPLARSFFESFLCLGGTAAAEDRPVPAQQCLQAKTAAEPPQEADPKSPWVYFLPVSTPLL